VNKRWDVLGIGCGTVDELLYVPNYPPPDTKIAIERRERQCGGLTVTALVAAARQGARCAYGGALGHDEDSEFVLAMMRQEGIDLAPVSRHEDAGPIHATIIVDQTAHTRNILLQCPKIVGPLADAPTAEDVRSARVLIVDHYGGEATARAQCLAKQADVPVVADLERDNLPAFAGILTGSDHLIISERFAAKLTGRADPAAAALQLHLDRQVVIVTCGAAGCWAIARGDVAATHFAAFEIKAVDTTGCGDTFHGVYAAELARGADLPHRIRRASAAAALKATQLGAQKGIPRREELDRFLMKHGQNALL
jgi:sugar/nucleoside kinase (ribokinase family)